MSTVDPRVAPALLALGFVAALAACGGEPVAPLDGGDDAAADAGPDSGPDAAPPADADDLPELDADPDQIPDAEPPADADQPGPADADQVQPAPLPIDQLDDLRLVINLGDSLAAGYNAAGRNGSGGHGYARLLMDNHPDYPAYAGHTLTALFPGVELRDLGDSGATSSDTLGNLRDALGGGLPREVDGDVLVLLTCGGNDFNDDWVNMALEPATRAIGAALQANYREIFRLLRERYERPELGRAVVFLVTNVHDPTGGTGTVPESFDDGFCGTIQRFPAAVARLAIANLGVFNTYIADVTAELGGHLVDNHDVFLDHGMNAGPERWIDTDCVHPINMGHHQLRRRHWQVLTGESY